MISLPFFRKRHPEKIEIREGYDLWSSHYAGETNPIKLASNQSIKELLPDLKGKSIMDAGCGTGYFCQYAEEQGASRITGIDFSESMLNKAKQNCKRTQFVAGEIQSIELGEKADIIICALVLGHLQHITPVLSVFARNLVAGGVLVLTDFHPDLSEKGHKRTFQIGKKVFEIPHYLHRLEEYREILNKSGFILEDLKDIFWKDLPVVFALRARKGQS